MNDSQSDDELIARLSSALATARVESDEDVRHRLLAAVAADQVVVLADAAHRRARRRFTRHASALSLGIAGVVALAGVAAAAVATNTLPGPTRAIAYDLGLPITSPALEGAKAHLAQLVHANANGDTTTARRVGRQLIANLLTLDRSDLDEIRTVARAALAQADLLSLATGLLGPLPVPTTGATTTVPVTTASTTTTTSDNLGAGVSPPSDAELGVTVENGAGSSTASGSGTTEPAGASSDLSTP